MHPDAPSIFRVVLRTVVGRVNIVVEDDGPGIPADDVDHIFDAFYRGRSIQWSETPGTGLGLAIARTIVEAHGGRIRAENRPGGGARFTITLPVAVNAGPTH